MRMRGVITALPLLGLIAVTAGEARAQCAFDQSYPNANDVLPALQEPITLQFSIELELKDVRLFDESRTEVPIDWVRSPAEVRSAEFRPREPLPPGSYSIEWNGYVRRHWHPDGGSVPFTIASADGTATAAPVSPAAAPTAGGVPRVGPASPYRALLGAGAPSPGR